MTTGGALVMDYRDGLREYRPAHGTCSETRTFMNYTLPATHKATPLSFVSIVKIGENARPWKGRRRTGRARAYKRCEWGQGAPARGVRRVYTGETAGRGGVYARWMGARGGAGRWEGVLLLHARCFAAYACPRVCSGLLLCCIKVHRRPAHTNAHNTTTPPFLPEDAALTASSVACRGAAGPWSASFCRSATQRRSRPRRRRRPPSSSSYRRPHPFSPRHQGARPR